MKRIDKQEAEWIAAHYEGVSVNEDFWKCKHGIDKCEGKCQKCEEEVQEALGQK